MSINLLRKHEILQVKGSKALGRNKRRWAATQTIPSQQKKQKRSPRAYSAKKCGFLSCGLTAAPGQPHCLTFPCLLLQHPERCLGLHCSDSCLCHAQAGEEALCLRQGCVALPHSCLTHLGHLRSQRADYLHQDKEVEVEVEGGQHWEEGAQEACSTGLHSLFQKLLWRVAQTWVFLSLLPNCQLWHLKEKKQPHLVLFVGLTVSQVFSCPWESLMCQICWKSP